MRTYSLRKRILVTGGNDMLCVDNFFTGMKDNFAHLIENTRSENAPKPSRSTNRAMRIDT